MPPDSEVRVGFIGVGTLGRGLALAMHGVGCEVTGAASRRRESAEWLADRIEGCRALESAQAVADACDLVFITTPDGAITEVAASVRWRGAPGRCPLLRCGVPGVVVGGGGIRRIGGCDAPIPDLCRAGGTRRCG